MGWNVRMIETILKKIELSLTIKYPDVFKSLAPPATTEQLNQLKKHCFSNAELPKELRTLYQWHNGQTLNHSFNQNDNFSFLSLNELIDAWEFLNDPNEDILEPISKGWIPLAYNGAGDCLIYVNSGINAGKILHYWHDDMNRPIHSDCLYDWLKRVLTSSEETQ